MNINAAAERKSVWVFGVATKDLCVFLLPLIAAYILFGFFGHKFAELKQNFTIYAFFFFVLNAGHIFGTTFPILLDGQLRQKIGPIRIWLNPALVILSFGAICIYDVTIFKRLFGLFTLFHILMQHFNWLRVLQKREASSPHRQAFERLVFLTIVVVPISIWCTGQNSVSPSYLHADDISLKFSFVNLRLLILPASALWLGYLLYLIRSAFRSPASRSYGKILLFATLYPWLFGSLIWLNSSLIFFVYAIGSHAVGYYLYLGYGWNRRAAQEKIHVYLPFIVPIVCAITAVAWNKTTLVLLSLLPPQLLFLIWIPVILHYVYDGILWRRTRAERRSV